MIIWLILQRHAPPAILYNPVTSAIPSRSASSDQLAPLPGGSIWQPAGDGGGDNQATHADNH